MISPLEIEKKDFSKVMRGYNPDEVDEFLDEIIVTLEQLMQENTRLKNEVAALQQENDNFKGAESDVRQIMDQAKGLLGDISASAEKRAATILKNAELDAELAVREAKNRASELLEENQRLEKRYRDFRDRYRRELEEELARFNNLRDGIYLGDDTRLEDLVNEPVVRQSSLNDSPKAEDAKAVMEDRRTVIVANE